MKEQPELTIYEVPTVDLVPYANNAKEHTREQVETIVNSIEDYGFNDPIAVWHNAEGNMEIVEGHGRVLAAKRMGLDNVPVIYLDHLSDQQRREYVHVHNQTTLNSDMDMDILASEFDDFTGFDPVRFGFSEIEDVTEGLSDDYSQNIGEVVYEPKDTQHEVSELYDYDEARFYGLIEGIQDEELKDMLRLRAAWFCDFDFAKIADYYAYQATPEVQRVFEALELVLLDRDQLIENGFADIVENLGVGVLSNEPKRTPARFKREHDLHNQQGATAVHDG